VVAASERQQIPFLKKKKKPSPWGGDGVAGHPMTQYVVLRTLNRFKKEIDVELMGKKRPKPQKKKPF